MNKKLYRSKNNRIIGGICGGLADYFKIDPLIIRLAWIVLVIVNNAFVILYLIGLVLIPRKDDEESTEIEVKDKNGKLAMIIGIGFVVWGAVKIAERIFEELDISFFPFNTTFSIFTWPVMLIIVGIFVILLVRRKDK